VRGDILSELRTNVRRRSKLQADIFDAFDRTNFRDMEVNPADGAFGTPTTSSNPRTIRLGMKFTFQARGP
jgi:hypothetical protein